MYSDILLASCTFILAFAKICTRSVALVDGDDCSTDIERLSVHAIPVQQFLLGTVGHFVGAMIIYD